MLIFRLNLVVKILIAIQNTIVILLLLIASVDIEQWITIKADL